jgi:hypothetical protein
MRGATPITRRPHLSPLAGRGRIALAIRVRGSIRKRAGDRLKHTRDIAQHIIVPKSQYAVVMVSEPLVSDNVAATVSMLTAIDLYNQSTVATDKVRGIGTNRLLPHKLMPIQPPCSKVIPKHSFGIRQRASQSPRPLSFSIVGTAHLDIPPHPPRSARRPLPACGERQRYYGNS